MMSRFLLQIKMNKTVVLKVLFCILLPLTGILLGFYWIFPGGLYASLSKTPAYGVIGLCSIIAGAVCLIIAFQMLTTANCSISRFYLCAAIPFGILYLFLIPPMSAPDERSHFNTAYAMAAEWYGIEPSDSPFEQRIRTADSEEWMLDEYVTSRADYDRVWADLEKKLSSDEKKFSVDVLYLSNKRSIAYAPAAIVMYIGFHFGWSFSLLALAATIPNVILFIAGMYYAISKMPYGKAPMALLALLPISIQQGASLSYDALLLPAAFLITALGLRWSERGATLSDVKISIGRNRSDLQRTSLSELILFLISAILLLNLKGGICFPLVFLCPLLSLRKRKKHRCDSKRGILLACIIAVVLMLWLFAFGAWDRIIHLLYDRPYLVHVFKYGRAPIYYIRHPDVLLSMIKVTIQKEGRDLIYQLFGGRLGWLHMYANHYISYSLVLLFLLMMIRPVNESVFLGAWKRFVLIILGGLPCALSVAAMLFYHTTAGSSQILGIQGRYFLPSFLPMMLGLFYWRKPVRSKMRDPYLLILALFLSWISTMSSFGFLS